MEWHLLLLLASVVQLSSGQAEIDYVCPATLNCHCSTLTPERLDAVQAWCETTVVTEVYMSFIPGNLTTWLTIVCTDSAHYSDFWYPPFTHLTSLTQLTLLHCRFKSFPPGVFEGLSALEILQLTDIGHPDLTYAFHPLLSLQVLDIANNTYVSFPHALFCGLTELTELYLGYNNLNSLEATGLANSSDEECLPKLGVFQIAGNRIGQLDYPLKRISDNFWAILFQESKIDHISERVFSGLSVVSYINLSSNALTDFAETVFADVPGLQFLYLQENMLYELPLGMFNVSQSLLELNFGGNQLSDTALEKLIAADFSQLVWLNISAQQISGTGPTPALGRCRPGTRCLLGATLEPEGTDANRPIRLNSSASTKPPGITALPEFAFDKMPNLAHLHIHDNTVQTIGDYAFRSLQNLKILDVHHNTIHTLTNRTFAGRLSTNSKTLSVNLSHNTLADLVGGIFQEHLPLVNLDLSHNDLESISDEAILSSGINALHLSHNHLTQIPTTIRHLSSLQHLDLTANDIQHISNIFDDDQLSSRSLDSQTSLQSLQVLQMKSSKIRYLPRSAFAWAPNLQRLHLGDNSISSVEYAAFNGLDQLKHLDLQYNSIADLTLILQPLLHLTELYLSHNLIGDIKQELFPASLETILLDHNKISLIDSKTFAHMDQLKLIDLTSNEITSLYGSSLEISQQCRYRPHALLAGNQFRCTCHMVWLRNINKDTDQVYVEDLNRVQCKMLDDAISWPVDLQADEFMCTYTEYCPIVSCDCCDDESGGCACVYHCPSACSCMHSNDRTPSIINCHAASLTQFPEALNPGATHLLLDSNNIPILPTNAFLPNSQLQTLYLNSSQIVDIQPDFFNNAGEITTLYLQSNLLSHLSPDMFRHLSAILELHLEDNRLDEIADGTFSEMPTLVELYLHNNFLVYVDAPAVFSMLNLAVLSLSGNPWSCDCTPGMAFKRWIANNTAAVFDAKNVMCHRNHSAANESVAAGEAGDPTSNNLTITSASAKHDALPASAAPDSFMLAPTKPILQEDFDYCLNTTEIVYNMGMSATLRATLIASAVILVAVITITLLVFNSREIIKVWLFNRYGLRLNIISEDESRPYDAFISYAFKDQTYVMDELARKLEEEAPDYKLCVHYRDWRVGVCIAQSIIESVDKSRRTIIVLSENFIKSEWCYLEFKTAHHRVLKERKNRIIIIMLDDDPPKNMDSDLKLYISSNTYLKKSDPWFWEKLRYAMPVKRRAESREPAAVV